MMKRKIIRIVLLTKIVKIVQRSKPKKVILKMLTTRRARRTLKSLHPRRGHLVSTEPTSGPGARLSAAAGLGSPAASCPQLRPAPTVSCVW